MGGNVLKLKSEELIEQGIEAFILDKLEDNCSEDEIIARLQKRFQLTEEKAKKYFEKYGTVLAQQKNCIKKLVFKNSKYIHWY